MEKSVKDAVDDARDAVQQAIEHNVVLTRGRLRELLQAIAQAAFAEAGVPPYPTCCVIIRQAGVATHCMRRMSVRYNERGYCDEHAAVYVSGPSGPLGDALATLDAAAKQLETTTIDKCERPDATRLGDGSIYYARQKVRTAGRMVAIAALEEAAAKSAAYPVGDPLDSGTAHGQHRIRDLASKVPT